VIRYAVLGYAADRLALWDLVDGDQLPESCAETRAAHPGERLGVFAINLAAPDQDGRDAYAADLDHVTRTLVALIGQQRDDAERILVDRTEAERVTAFDGPH
jgi:hypothetical protein